MKKAIQFTVIILGIPIMIVSAIAAIICSFFYVGWGFGWEDFWS